MRRTRRPAAPPVALALLAGLVPAGLGAQTPLSPALGGDSTLVERVVAVVGDSAILMSEVVEESAVTAQQGRPASAAEVLETLVRAQLVLQAAARDSTIVPDGDLIADRVEEAYSQARDRIQGGTDAFHAALEAQGMTPQSFRDQLRHRIRVQQIQELYIQRALRDAPPVAVSEAEMRAFFEEQRRGLGQRPEVLELEQVLVRIDASDSSWTRAKAEADSLYGLIVRDSADFATLAREHSDDPGSAPDGGDLGWFGRRAMVLEFERVAFALRDGGTSAPVRTDYGYHIIRVERSRPGERRARHILIAPERTPQDEVQAMELAREIASRAREGESMQDLHEEFGESDQPARFETTRQDVQQLPPGYATKVVLAREGDVLDPFATRLGQTPFVAVVKVADIRESGQYTFEDVREQVRQALTQRKRIDRIFEQLRAKTYVDIRL